MKKIELPSEELAEELQKYLQEKRFAGATYEKGAKTIEFPGNMSLLQWSSLKGMVEKWARGRSLEVEESLRILPPVADMAEAPVEKVDLKELEAREAEVKKKLVSLTPDEAEERYNYLESKPISELTDAEFEERLALAQRKPGKAKS